MLLHLQYAGQVQGHMSTDTLYGMQIGPLNTLMKVIGRDLCGTVLRWDKTRLKLLQLMQLVVNEQVVKDKLPHFGVMGASAHT